MTNDLDSILTGAGEAMPASETPTAPQDQQQTGANTEQVAAPEGEPAEAEGEQRGQTTVPVAALQAERQKVKRYTEEVADFRRSNEALQRQVSELLQRIPAPQQQQQPKPDFFENPEHAVGYTVQDTIQRTVAPQLSHFEKMLLHQSKMVAEQAFGKDKVQEAEAAFMEAVNSGAVHQSMIDAVASSPNRWEVAVEWFERQQRMAPDFEEKLRTKLEAEILTKHGLNQTGQAPAQAQRPAVMPSNFAGARNVGTRTGSAWAGPQSIDDILSKK